MGERIKKLMIERGVNQAQLAEIAGTSATFIGNILRGIKLRLWAY